MLCLALSTAKDMASKWCSKEVWLSALASKREELVRAERPGFILYRHGELSLPYTRKHISDLRRTIARIEAAGEAEWQEELHAQGT